MELLIVLGVIAVAYYFAAKNGHVPKFWEKDED